MKNSKLKVILTIIAFVLIAAIIGGVIWYVYDNKTRKEPSEDNEQAFVTDDNGEIMADGTVYAMPTAMTVRAAALSNSNTVDVRIEAYVYPDTAENKAVDYFVAWGTAPEHGSEPVTNYLTVTPDTDGSTLATVSCKKAFGNDKIIITVTTRDGGYTATCTVSFIGIASGITITSNNATQKNTTERGSYYELGTNKNYTFNINLSNVFNSVGKSNLSVSVGASGSLYFGDGYCDPNSGITRISNVQKLELSSLKDKFIKSATVSGNTLTVTTGKYIVEGFCDPNDYYTDEYDNVYYRNCYLYEDEWGLVGPQYTSDTAKCTENEQWIKSCYFTVTVTDSVSGLSETVKLWVTSSVSGVSLSKTTLTI